MPRSPNFETGVIYACARLIELHDEPTMANDILRESGVDLANGDEYDLAFLRKARLPYDAHLETPDALA